MEDHKSALMGFCWHDYKNTGDKMALVHALRMADFFGQPQIQEEIEDILIDAFKLKGAALKSHFNKSIAESLFKIEMQKPGATKTQAYKAIGKQLKMDESAVRMMLKRVKRGSDLPPLTSI